MNGTFFKVVFRSGICAFLLSVFSIIGFSQEISFTNDRAIDPNRYDDTKGNPYYFEDWVTGSIMRNDARIFEGLKLNYNGYTRSFEVMSDGKMIELDGELYLRVSVERASNLHQADFVPTDEVAFQRGLHPKFNNSYVVILLNENNVMLIKEFWVDVSDHDVQGVGETITFKRFNRKENYYIKEQGRLVDIRLKKKHVLSKLDDAEVASYVRENKLKFNEEKDLVEVVKFYASLDSN